METFAVDWAQYPIIVMLLSVLYFAHKEFKKEKAASNLRNEDQCNKLVEEIKEQYEKRIDLYKKYAVKLDLKIDQLEKIINENRQHENRLQDGRVPGIQQ